MRQVTVAMVIRGTPTPEGFHKGDILRPVNAASNMGWRPLTGEERDQWYKQHYEDVKAGRDLPYDSAGESRLAPQDIHIPLRADRTYEVVRGRVTAPDGYGKTKGCCEVVDMLDGTRFYCKRKHMVRA
jgi:hypothetical protein